jgi:hypothetical protein
MKAMYIMLMIVATAGLSLLFPKAFGNGSEVKLPSIYRIPVYRQCQKDPK